MGVTNIRDGMGQARDIPPTNFRDGTGQAQDRQDRHRRFFVTKQRGNSCFSSFSFSIAIEGAVVTIWQPSVPPVRPTDLLYQSKVPKLLLAIVAALTMSDSQKLSAGTMIELRPEVQPNLNVLLSSS